MDKPLRVAGQIGLERDLLAEPRDEFFSRLNLASNIQLKADDKHRQLVASMRFPCGPPSWFDKGNEDHIAAHGLTPQEVEEVFANDPMDLEFSGRSRGRPLYLRWAYAADEDPLRRLDTSGRSNPANHCL
jgi:hypothetical protein